MQLIAINRFHSACPQNRNSLEKGYQIKLKICQNILYSHCFMSQNKFILTFLKMDLRRSGFIFLRLEFIIYGKLPFEYTLVLGTCSNFAAERVPSTK